MDFINSTIGFWVLAYLTVGCIIMKLVDRGTRNINTLAWILGAIGWLPVTLMGFFVGVFRKR
jgi:hypothetical protein